MCSSFIRTNYDLSNARSPLLAHFSATMHGLVSVRAYGAQESFEKENMQRIDFYSRTARISWNLNRWISVRIESLGALFTSALAAYLVYGKPVGAGNTGLSLTMAKSFCLYIFWVIRIYNELEIESNRFVTRSLGTGWLLILFLQLRAYSRIH